MKKILQLNQWNRKEHFDFFSKFSDPYFGLVFNVECTNAYDYCKEKENSFFLYYLFQSLKAANICEPFKYRIENNQVVEYDVIHASPTINRHDETFGFSFMPFAGSFIEFSKSGKKEIERIRKNSGLCLNEHTMRTDVIHYSVLPWFSFTGITHARNFEFADSVPKITFGKYFTQNEKIMLPISINAHHGLMDGYHIAAYVEVFENLLQNK